MPKKVKSPAKKEVEKSGTEEVAKKEEKTKDNKDEEEVMPDDISHVG